MKEYPVSLASKATLQGQAHSPLADLLYRQFLGRLAQGQLLPVEEVEEDLSFFLRNDLRLLHVERLVYEKKREKLEELLNLYGALYSSGCAIICVIESDGEEIRFYLGVRQQKETADVPAAAKILESCFHGQFTGSRLKLLKNNEVKAVLESPLWSEINGIAALTGIPSRKTEKDQQFVQGLDRFLDGMRGEEFSVIMVADPIPEEEIERSRQGYAALSTLLSALSERQYQWQQSASSAISEAEQESFSKALAHTAGETQSTTTSRSKTKNRPSMMGYGLAGTLAMVGGAAAILATGPVGLAAVAGTAAAGAAGGAGLGALLGGQKSDGATSSESRAASTSQTTTETTSKSHTHTETQTHGTTSGHTFTEKNRLLQYHLEQIDRHLGRLQEGGRYGFWNTGMYFLSRTTEKARMASAIFQGLFRGKDSDLEHSRINVWSRSKHKQFPLALQAIQRFRHPAIAPDSLLPTQFAEDAGLQQLHPTSLLSSSELALVMGFPEHSLPGLPVRTAASFGRQISTSLKESDRRRMTIGPIYHLGQEDSLQMSLDIDSLSLHTLITGTTGSGKTNACFELVRRLVQNDIPCLVIEPCKGEYAALKALHNEDHPIHVLKVGDPKGSLLQMNPFRFPPEIHILEHIDRLGQLFCAAFPMYAAMPAILDDALHRVYEHAGWDLGSSTYIEKVTRYPTLQDLVALLPQVIDESGYSDQLSADYHGALVTRLRSLTRGLRGRSLCPLPHQETPDNLLFSQTCIIDLKAVGSAETRALLMGLLLLKLYEHRQQCGRRTRLQHVTVLEEAHNLLRRTSLEQSQDHANARGLAVEMFTNAIAEMRAYGEGFVIVDQSASSLDLGVIKNTNTKITLRTPYQTDRELVGKAANMDEEQIAELGRLETGVAAIYQNDWIEPVLCRFPHRSLPTMESAKEHNLSPVEVLVAFAIPNWIEFAKREHVFLEFSDLTSAQLCSEIGQRLYPQDPDKLEALLSALFQAENPTPEHYLAFLELFPEAMMPAATIHSLWAVLGFLIKRQGTSHTFAAHILARISGWQANNILERLARYL